MTSSSPVQNCFADASGATIRIVKGEWDTSNGGDPQPRLSVSIPSSQLQFHHHPYYGSGYPPQVQLLSTSTSQYPSTEKLPLGGGGVGTSSSSARSGVENGNGNGNGNGIRKSASSPRTSADWAGTKKQHTIGPAPTPEPAVSKLEPETEQQQTRLDNDDPKEGTTPKPKPAKPATDSESPPKRRKRKPTKNLTPHQIFYIFVVDGLGAMILSGAINFAIAYAMYNTSHPAGADDTPPPPILLFHLPNSLAGDAAVTIILQTVITWLVEFFLVRRDLERGGVAPVGFVRIPHDEKGKSAAAGLGENGNGKGKEPGTGAGAGYETDLDLEKGNGNVKGSTGGDGKGQRGEEKTNRRIWSWRGFVRWFCFINDDDDRHHHHHHRRPTEEDPSAKQQPPKPEAEDKNGGGVFHRISTLGSQILRALLVAVVMFFLLWGPFVGVLMALGRKDPTIGARGDWVFDQRVWLPQVFKLVLGGLLALLETPAFAFFWVVKGGWDFQMQTQTQTQTRDQSGLATADGAGGEGGRRASMTDEEV